eukprot:6481846-Amphidinium_carterae.2
MSLRSTAGPMDNSGELRFRAGLPSYASTLHTLNQFHHRTDQRSVSSLGSSIRTLHVHVGPACALFLWTSCEKGGMLRSPTEAWYNSGPPPTQVFDNTMH